MPEQPHKLLAFLAHPVKFRKLAFEHQIENMLGIPPVILLSSFTKARNLGGIADPDFDS